MATNRRFRIAVVLVSILAAVAGSVALAMRGTSEKTTRRGVALTLPVPGHPGALVAGPDALWVALSDDRRKAAGDGLLRLDLSTGIRAPAQPLHLGGEISHLTRVGDRLIASVQHVSRAGQLASLDWRTGVVSAWHWFDPSVDQVVVRGGEVWALATRPGTLLRLDSKTLAPTSSVRLTSGRALGLASGGGYVWVTAADDGEVLRIDPQTHAVERVHVGGFPMGIVVTGGTVWIADHDAGEVVRLDPQSLRRVGEPIRVGTRPSRLIAAGGSLFVTDEDDGTLVRIDVPSGKRVGLPIRIAAPTTEAPAPSVARAGQSVWVSSFASRTLDRIDPGVARGGSKLTVRISGTNDQQQGDAVTSGGLAGVGQFTASGAISGQGKAVAYRTVKGSVITLRFVISDHKGTVTFLVKIDMNNPRTTPRWTITSATKVYKGLHGEGTEHENAHFTVQTLTGTVTN